MEPTCDTTIADLLHHAAALTISPEDQARVEALLEEARQLRITAEDQARVEALLAEANTLWPLQPGEEPPVAGKTDQRKATPCGSGG